MRAHTFKDWLAEHRGQVWLSVSRADWKGPWWLPRGYRWLGWLPDLRYYLACRLWRRYNTISCPTLPPTWSDADTRLLHANFAILVGVVDNEGWFTHWAFAPEQPCDSHDCEICKSDDIEGPDYWRQRMDECQEVATLYDWWVNRRPARLDPTGWWVAQCAIEGLDTGWDSEPCEDTPHLSQLVWRESGARADRIHELNRQSHAMEGAQEAEDDAMLHRLMAIRHTLWT